MSASISVDRHWLTYRNGGHELRLSVEWSGVAKTPDCPIDFEVDAGDLATWSAPAGEPISEHQREQILDEIAEYYSNGPKADIVGGRGVLLRGQSSFRFSLQIPPSPSYYSEVGRILAVPMQGNSQARDWNRRYIADFSSVTHWTEPSLALDARHIALIAQRIADRHGIGIMGVPRGSCA